MSDQYKHCENSEHSRASEASTSEGVEVPLLSSSTTKSKVSEANASSTHQTKSSGPQVKQPQDNKHHKKEEIMKKREELIRLSEDGEIS